MAAQNVIYAAVSERLDGVSGRYLDKCSYGLESSLAQDATLASKLWEVSLLMTGCLDGGKIVEISPKFQYLDDDELWERKLERIEIDKNGKEPPILAPDALEPITRL